MHIQDSIEENIIPLTFSDFEGLHIGLNRIVEDRIKSDRSDINDFITSIETNIIQSYEKISLFDRIFNYHDKLRKIRSEFEIKYKK